MSKQDEVRSALAQAEQELQQLKESAAQAKVAPKLVRSGRAAELKALAATKELEVSDLRTELRLSPEGPPNMIEKEDGRLLTFEENKAERSRRPWWRFW